MQKVAKNEFVSEKRIRSENSKKAKNERKYESGYLYHVTSQGERTPNSHLLLLFTANEVVAIRQTHEGGGIRQVRLNLIR